MTETIQMTFHKAETKAEAVKGRRFTDFKKGDRVTPCPAYGAILADSSIVGEYHDGNGGPKKVRICPDGYVSPFFNNEAVWYLDSDIINGRPREIAGEPIRKTVGELKAGEVFELEGRRWYKSSSEILYCDGSGRPDSKLCIAWPPELTSRPFASDLVVTILGYVTFESAKGTPPPSPPSPPCS